MFDKASKRKLKVLAKWFCLASFIAVLLFLHLNYGKTESKTFSIFAGGPGMFIYGMNLMSNPDNEIEDLNNASSSIDSLKKQRNEITRELNKFLIALSQKDLSENLSRQVTLNLNLSQKDAEEIRQQIYSQTMLDHAARNNLLHRIKDGQHDPFESIVLLDTLRSIASLLSSFQHVCDHLLFKF